ncbi:MAG: Ldh family oxidoreductase [Geminicoccaceae bacterium]|nr:MAG: Ldh family oxidoreductase [Geminicoccaceae bacterium]
MTVRLPLAEVEALSRRCLVACGADAANAEAVTRTIVRAEQDHSVSHGLFRLPGYCASLKSGKVDGHARPTVERPAPSVVRVDGKNAFAPLALDVGREPLIETAKRQGVAALALVRVHHFSALWAEVEPLAEAGLVALACTAYKPVVAPAGARQPFFGTNPLAFAWPRGKKPPYVFDMATSAMARGEIQVAARDGHAVPLGAGLDAAGEATTDPNAILDGGVQLPFGGYKGSAIMTMVELLCAGLIGERFSDEAAKLDNDDGGPPQGGEFMLALDPQAFGHPNWLEHSDAWLERLAGLEGVRLPGQRRHEARQKTPTTGITIPSALHAELLALAG